MTVTNNLIDFDKLPNAAHIRVHDVAILFACSPLTIWRRVKEGKFPQPKRMSEGITAWNVGDVRQALAKFGGKSHE